MTGVRRASLMVWLLLACLLLSSCTGGSIPVRSDTAPTLTLPPSSVRYVAPIGDAALEYTAQVALYLPRHDGTRLVSITDEVALSAARPHAESIVRALLSHEGNGAAMSLGGGVRLALYGANPVEVSRDVVTVNLAASALQLDRKSLYLTCQAITNTLTGLNGIHYVNVLVMDKQVGLDIAGILPMGTFSRSAGADIGAVFDQVLSQRVGMNENPATTRLSSMVTLYFPLPGEDGILPEVRAVSFDSQRPADMALRLLQEMTAGPQQVTASPALPLLADLLTEAPQISDEAGGTVVSLRFAHNFDDMLATFGLTRANTLAAICYTFTTFLPDVVGIRVTIGDETLQNVRLGHSRTGDVAVLFQNAIQCRSDYAVFLLDLCTLYFADVSGQKLVAVQRPIPYYLTTQPRALVLELAKGPLPGDSVQSAQPIMPLGALRDSDMLGFSLNGNTLLVNFAPHFNEIGQGITPQQDRLLAYGLVNTLACIPRIQSVCFFVSGESPGNFSDEIQWTGDFYENPGLVH